MKDNRFKGIIALVVITIISFTIIIASKILIKDEDADKKDNNKSVSSIDVNGQEGIKAANKLQDDNGNLVGYKVTAEANGFVGTITWDITFDVDAKTITDVSVVSHTESDGYGSKMEEENFLSQFQGIKAPIYLAGNLPASNNEESKSQETMDTALTDGVYFVEEDEGAGDYRHSLTLKVEDGAITSVVWDSKNEDGEYKSYLSSVGKYVMTEDGLTWKEQADALAEVVLSDQSTEGILLDEDGKTDSVAGVSINITSFIELTEEALELASTGEGGAKKDSDSRIVDYSSASEIDAISSATVTSEAIVELVNNAYNFISEYTAQ